MMNRAYIDAVRLLLEVNPAKFSDQQSELRCRLGT